MRLADELSELTLSRGCGPQDLERVAAAITGVRTFIKGEVLCHEGEKADRWWIDALADVTVGGIDLATIGPGLSSLPARTTAR